MLNGQTHSSYFISTVPDLNKSFFDEIGLYWPKAVLQGHGVIPDIVTMAKGIGNGFPMAAVVTTPEIAATMARVMYALSRKYFHYLF